jgi:hypothetical protein
MAGKGVKPGQPLVMRKYDAKDVSQPVVFVGKKVENKKSKRCLQPANGENKNLNNIQFWPCTGKEGQKWIRVEVEGSYAELCKDIVKDGKRYRVCPGKENKFLGAHCVRHVVEKNGVEKLVKKCGKQTWELATCNRYKQKGQWFRKCGASHLEHVKNGGKQTDN